MAILDAPTSLTSASAATAARERTLDPADWESLRALGHRMVDDMLGWTATVRDRPAWQAMPPAAVERVAAPLPEQGIGAEAAYERFLRDVRPWPLGNLHPRFWGWVIGSGSPLGALADFLASSFNPNVSGLASAAIPVEDQVLDWLKELVGFPATAGGLLASGGSMANTLGMAVAIDAMAEFDLADDGLSYAPRPMTLYASTETHNSVLKGARLLGLGRSALRKVPVDARYRIDLDALAASLRADRAAGCHPFLLVGNAGTVNTGAFDDLERLADFAAREKLWFHVDGAFGALAAAVPELAAKTRGMERADSLAFDLHKWMHAPIEAACILVRDAAAQRRAFVNDAAYLAALDRGPAHHGTRFADRGPQLTRGFRALKIWMELQAHGAGLYRELLTQNVEQAAALAALVEADPELELLAPVELNIVCYRFRPAGVEPARLDALNQEILLRLQERGIAVPSHTLLGGRFAIRVCIANHRTRREDLALLVAETKRLGAELLAERTG